MSNLLSTSAQIGAVTLKNRIIMAPMQRWQGTAEAYATEYHVSHYGERAKGGLGLVIVESTSIDEGGRLFQNDIGIYTDKHIEPLRKVVDEVHKAEIPIFIQLCHGGRKASPENKGKMLAPSAIAFDDEYGVPHEMTNQDIKQVIEQFGAAAKRSVQAGFDGIELHAAHGYLLHQFLSPLSNQRGDEYGGSLENRLRLLKEVLQAVRVEVGKQYPVMVRVSARDYHPEGLSADELGKALQMLLPLGLDGVHVSTGGLLPNPPSEVYPGYQASDAEIIKKYVDISVIAVGLIHTKELAEEILSDNKADFIAIGSPLLENPEFVQKWSESLNHK
jgi:NADPH2 dehydrogenase